MIEKIQILISQIENDLKTIATLFSRISPYEKKQPQTLEELIAVGYHLHNLYCAFENIFKNIAQSFENQIVDTTQWHAELLKLMKLEIRGIRPNVISQRTHNCLDELRRFRHLFRAAYDIELDWERMALVVKKAMQLKQTYRKDINRFLQFLNDMQKVEGSGELVFKVDRLNCLNVEGMVIRRWLNAHGIPAFATIFA